MKVGGRWFAERLLELLEWQLNSQREIGYGLDDDLGGQSGTVGEKTSSGS